MRSPEELDTKEQVSVESREGHPERGVSLSADSYAKFEEKRADLLARAGAEARSLGFGEEELQARMERDGLTAALERTKAAALAARDRFRAAAMLALFGGMLAVAPERLAAAERIPVATPAEMAAELAGEEKGLEVFSEAEVQRMVLFDDHERAFVISSDMPSVIFKTAEGSRTETPIWDLPSGLEDPMERMMGGSKEGVICHTHPLEDYTLFGYSAEEIAAVREGRMEPPPAAPPSIVDLGMLNSAENTASGEEVCVKSRVYGPDGYWDMIQTGADSPFWQELSKMNSELREITGEFTDSLSPELRQRLQRSLEEPSTYRDVRQGMLGVWQDIMADPLLKDKARPYLDRLAAMTGRYCDTFEKAEKFNQLQIAASRRDGVEKARAEYIKFVSELNIQASFHPYARPPAESLP